MLSCYNLYDVDFTKKSIVKQTIIKHKKQKKYYVKDGSESFGMAVPSSLPGYIKKQFKPMRIQNELFCNLCKY